MLQFQNYDIFRELILKYRFSYFRILLDSRILLKLGLQTNEEEFRWILQSQILPIFKYKYGQIKVSESLYLFVTWAQGSNQSE